MQDLSTIRLTHTHRDGDHGASVDTVTREAVATGWVIISAETKDNNAIVMLGWANADEPPTMPWELVKPRYGELPKPDFRG